MYEYKNIMSKKISESRSALVLDSDTTIGILTSKILTELGVENITYASDGISAKEYIRKFKFDIIISNLDLNKLNGLEVLKYVRSKLELKFLPFLILSSSTSYNDVSNAIRCGASDFIALPYNQITLRDKIVNLLKTDKKSFYKNNTDSIFIKKDNKPIILVVDDVVDNIKIIAESLKFDYTVLVANSASKALSICNSDNQPDLILLDIMMPDISGVGLCKTIKSNATLNHIAIIFITSLNKSNDIASGFKAGAIDYITKPMSPIVLKARIKSHLEIINKNKKMREEIDQLVNIAFLRKDLEMIYDEELNPSMKDIYNLLDYFNKYTVKNPEYNNRTLKLTESVIKSTELIKSMAIYNSISSGFYRLNPSFSNFYSILEELDSESIFLTKRKLLQLDSELSDNDIYVDNFLFKSVVLFIIKYVIVLSERASFISIIDEKTNSTNLLGINFCSQKYAKKVKGNDKKMDSLLLIIDKIAHFFYAELKITELSKDQNRFKIELIIREHAIKSSNAP